MRLISIVIFHFSLSGCGTLPNQHYFMPISYLCKIEG